MFVRLYSRGTRWATVPDGVFSLGPAQSRRANDVGRRAAQVPHQADEREQPQHVVGDVDLPPEEALVRGALVVVVVVVPALAQS